MVVSRIIRRLYHTYWEKLSALVTDIVALVRGSLSDEQWVERVLPELDEKLDRFNKSIWKERGSELTLKINEQDSVRDSCYSSFAAHVEADLFRVSCPEAKENAEKLSAVLDRVGRMMPRAMQDQTACLNQLFEQLDLPENTALINANGYQNVYSELKEAQSTFHALWTSRIDEESSREVIPTIRKASNELLDYLRDHVFKRLEIYADDQGEPYTSLISAINQAIEDAQTVQKSRETLKEKEPEDTQVAG